MPTNKEESMINRYETVFIMTPVLSEDQMKEAVKKYLKLLKDNGAKIILEDNWGLKKLAYPIQKKSAGFYYLVEFEVEGDFIKTWEISFKRDESILRFLTTKLNKHAIAYNEKKRLAKSKNKEAIAKDKK